MLQQERRSSGRKPLAQLAYIRLPSNNGGIVLDISEGGLGFHAVAPVEAGQAIHFRLSMKPVSATEAIGEVVWKDETGKSGGLRFTHLPEEVREQIRAWSGQPKLEPPVERAAEAPPAIRPVQVADQEAGIGALSKDSEIVAPAKMTQPVPIATSFSVTVNPLSMFPATPQRVVSRFPSPSSFSKRRFASLVLAILSASLVAVGVLSYYLHIHREAGESLVRWGEKMWRWFQF